MNWLCQSCMRGYRDHVAVCSDCGTESPHSKPPAYVYLLMQHEIIPDTPADLECESTTVVGVFSSEWAARDMIVPLQCERLSVDDEWTFSVRDGEVFIVHDDEGGNEVLVPWADSDYAGTRFEVIEKQLDLKEGQFTEHERGGIENYV